MRIAFDSVPLIADRMTGIGYCQAGQVKSLAKLYKNDKYIFQFFSVRTPHTKVERLSPYLGENATYQKAFFSGLGYRIIQNYIPVPYSMFFGKDADVTHFFNYIVPPKVNTATVVTVHDMVYRSYPETMNKRTLALLNKSLEKSMERATLIVTDSEFSKFEIIKYFPKFKDKIRVVYCGVDFSRFKKIEDKNVIQKVSEKYEINSKYFLYLGTLEPRKNLVRLIDAYAELKRRYAGEDIPKMVLAGGKGWLYDKIFEETEKQGLKDNVIFTGYVDDEDICPLISGAEAFVFPSVYEGFGLPPLEAMTCGVPVVVSDAASLPEVVGDCGVIVKSDSVDSIADGLEKIYTNPELRKELAQKGMERAKGFTWDKSAKQLHNVYVEADKIFRSGNKK